ncbi:hypothetical protein BCR33DRAFT_717192 [Rhizoclosmatium globosum]|uniref:Uncharacterized protein n=1 Tax=Rhizoclosmatium globosum TaxID=329046 RepID=A0A1Y2CB86_9FUNG|nr:hypothetical protein BCR33DRAFT_717192 [Rhizoclosmatium globosum]|eukprot:ORY44104.1 hypothetical protein BCR33DRAFT_717192 [Rhizoclosmatium globosum]
MSSKSTLPKALKQRSKEAASQQQQQSQTNPSSSTSTAAPATTSPPAPKKHNPFEKAESGLFILASVIFWLYVVGWVTGKPILGVLFTDPVRTLWEVLLGPFKVIGTAIGVDVEAKLLSTFGFGVETVLETVVKPAVHDEF